jgi:multicomponent K+:H+ antiporter subunit A
VLGAPPPEFQLALWHGFNLPLLMSAVAVAGGVALYFGLLQRGRLHRTTQRAGGRAAALHAGWSTACSALPGASRARWRTARCSAMPPGWWARRCAGRLGLLAGTAARRWPATRATAAGHAAGGGVWLVLLAAGGGAGAAAPPALRGRGAGRRGGPGHGAGLPGLSAPDLAMTQLSVDVVSTVLLLMGLALLPQFTPRESAAARWRDALLALAGGGGIAWLTWLVLTRDHERISWYFLEQSVPKGGGTNMVNVILVDFRGYDTFGEITVLGIAAVGVLALLDGLRVRRPAADAAGPRPGASPGAR